MSDCSTGVLALLLVSDTGKHHAVRQRASPGGGSGPQAKQSARSRTLRGLLRPTAPQVSSRSHLALLHVLKDRKRSLPVVCDAVAGLLNMSVDVEGKIAVIQAGGGRGR